MADKRKVDELVTPGSFLDRLRLRRKIGAEDLEQAPVAFKEPEKINWADLPVNNVVDNEKTTIDESDIGPKKPSRVYLK